METMEKELDARRVETESQSSLGLGVDLEKEESSKTTETNPESRGEAQYQQTVSRHTTRHTQHDGDSAHRVATAQDWTGPDDPENPRNWPKWKQYWHSIPPGLFAFSVYAAHDSLETLTNIELELLDLPCTHQATMKLLHDSVSQAPQPC